MENVHVGNWGLKDQQYPPDYLFMFPLLQVRVLTFQSVT